MRGARVPAEAAACPESQGERQPPCRKSATPLYTQEGMAPHHDHPFHQPACSGSPSTPGSRSRCVLAVRREGQTPPPFPIRFSLSGWGRGWKTGATPLQQRPAPPFARQGLRDECALRVHFSPSPPPHPISMPDVLEGRVESLSAAKRFSTLPRAGRQCYGLTHCSNY